MSRERFVESGDYLVAAQISEEAARALKEKSPSPDQIIEYLDSLNEEIVETNETYGAKTNMTRGPVARPNPAELKRQAADVKEVSRPKTRQEVKEEEIARTMPAPPKPAPRVRAPEPEVDDFSSLDADLDRIAGEAEGAEEEDSEVGANMHSQILDLLHKTPGAPKPADIERWKASLGKNAIYCVAFGEGDVYVFTHLKRLQWKKIQETMQKIAASDAARGRDLEDDLKEKVVQNCVLWPRPLPVEFFVNSRAGVVDQIYQAIMLQSYFLSTQQTMMLTTQL